ncbi:MAG TPA: TldD/PmbA family protein [Chloroflexi bacterium]|nr:TldD/PmbA family protein [Chloroflexota bacterium]
MLGQTEVQHLLERVLHRSPADQTEVLFLGLEEALTRFANNEIHQNVAEHNYGLIIRAAIGQRVVAISTTATDDASIEQALERAVALAKLQPENPEFPGFAEPVPLPETTVAYDEATATATPESRARAVGEVITYALSNNVNASGAFRTSRYEWGLANSHGLRAYAPTTLADLTIVGMTETSSGYAADAAWRFADIDVAARGREAVDKAVQSQNPRPLEPGDYPVVLEPYAAQDLVNFVGRGASGMSVHEGQSWMSGRQGEALFDKRITLVDDPQDQALWPLPFDFEGQPRQRVKIIKAGVVGDAVYNRLWGEKTGHATTGHALPAFSPFNPSQAIGGSGPFPIHLALEPGTASLQEMIKGIDRGLYITRFNYTRVVHPREVVITGLTRDGTFWIENGALAYPVQNLRFTQSYIEALAEVIAIGAEAQCERGYFGLSKAPALCLPRFRFTGTTGF